MQYLAIGLMSGSSLDGLDIVLATFQYNNERWTYQIEKADCRGYSSEWVERLTSATALNAREYLLLHSEFGSYCGEEVNRFLASSGIPAKPDVIGSHGHTTFHMPEKNMTHQLGEGANISASTKIAVVSDLRMADVALGGQGAPIVPIGEKMLFEGYRYFMNIGGICNVSIHCKQEVIAFDVSPANRVMNLLANDAGKEYDEGGEIAARGIVNKELLEKLNGLDYYKQPYPKSLANSFGTDVVYPAIKDAGLFVEDAMATMVEHIAIQTLRSLKSFSTGRDEKMLITGGGTFNNYLISRLQRHLKTIKIETVIPDADTISYKEALIMAFIAVLRLRDEPNVLATVTGAATDSCGGALWSVK